MLMVFLMELMIGEKNATMPFQIPEKNELMVDHAPCQSPEIRSITATTMVRMKSMPVCTILERVFQIPDTNPIMPPRAVWMNPLELWRSLDGH